MEYTPELEKRVKRGKDDKDPKHDVIKIRINTNDPQDKRALYFVPIEGTEKYEFCSNDERLQTWCENVKSKKVKFNQIMRVFDAARHMKSSDPIPVRASTPTKFNENPVGWVNEQCQAKRMGLPTYETVDVVQGGGLNLVTVEVDADWLDDSIVARASKAQKAKEEIAKEIAKIYFSEELEKELSQNNNLSNQKSSTENKTPTPGKAHSIENALQMKCPYNQYRWGTNPIGTMQEYCQQNGLSLPKYRRTQDKETLCWTVYMTLDGIDHKFIGSGKSEKEAKAQAIARYLDAMKKGKVEEKIRPRHNNGKDKLDFHTNAKAGFYIIDKTFYAVDDEGNVCQLANKDSKPRFLGKGLWLDFDKKTERTTLVENNTPLVSYDFINMDHGYGSIRYFLADGEPISKETFDKIVTDTFNNDRGSYNFSRAQSLSELQNGQVLTTLRQATAEEVLDYFEIDGELAEKTSRRDHAKYESYEWESLNEDIGEILEVQNNIMKSFRITKPKQPQQSKRPKGNPDNNVLAAALTKALGNQL